MSINSIVREFRQSSLELVNGKTLERLGKMESNGIFRTAVKAAAVAFLAGILPSFMIPSPVLSVAVFGLGLSYFARHYDINDALKDFRAFSGLGAIRQLVDDLVASVKARL